MFAEVVDERVIDVAPNDIAFRGDLANRQVLRAVLGHAAAQHSFDGKSVFRVRESDNSAPVQKFQRLVNGTFHHAGEIFGHENDFQTSADIFTHQNRRTFHLTNRMQKMFPRRNFFMFGNVGHEKSDIRRRQIFNRLEVNAKFIVLQSHGFRRSQNLFVRQRVFDKQRADKIFVVPEIAPKSGKRLITENNTIVAQRAVRVQNGLANNCADCKFVKLRRIERQ